MADIWMVYSTFATKDEAFLVTQSLLEKRLIACANLHEGVTSLYSWEGELKKDSEVVMIAKSQKNKVKKAIEQVKILHSYDLPCIVAYPIVEGYSPYLEWVAKETT